MSNLSNDVGRKRAAAGLRQQDLAARVGISRQSLSLVEGGRSVPSAAVALRLARALGCSMEDLFWVDEKAAPLTVELADDGALGGDEETRQPGPPATRSTSASSSSRVAGRTRVMLTSINGRWVGHPLTANDASAFLTAADGVVTSRRRGAARVAPLGDVAVARETLVCAGCAPAFGILSARASAQAKGQRVLWLDRSSHTALDLLAQGLIHVAGSHLFDEDTGEFNVPFVQRRFPQRSMLIFNLARWETGLVVAPGNPRGIRGARDLARPDLSFVRRQPGAAAQDLVDRLLRREGLPARTSPGAPLTARGHVEVARLVSLGLADAGVSLAAVARAHGLDFIPLAQERFDLVLAKELSADVRIVRLLETLTSQGLRRELQSLGGHVVRDAGQLVADTTPPS